jgi:hypothetical protein
MSETETETVVLDPKEKFWRFELDSSLGDLIDNNLEGFLDLLSERTTDTVMLMDIDYGIVGVAPGAGGTVDHLPVNGIRLWVTGDCSGIFDELLADLPEDADETEKDAAIIGWLVDHHAQSAR